MTEVGSAWVSVLPEAKGFGKKLQGQLDPELDKVGKSSGSKFGTVLGGAVGGFAAGGLALGLGKIKEFTTGAVDNFARVEDATAAAGVTFGQQLPKIEAFAGGAAQQFGISKGAALDAVLTFGTMGKAAGLTGDDLAGFGTKFAGLAGDMASFRGTSPEQAIEAIGAALRGETEPIRAYGVLLDDASLRNEAMRQGLIKTTNEALTPQQKVLASQALILQQTSAAQGDFARTSDSTANVQKTLAAETENASAQLGEKLAPAVTLGREVMLGLVTSLSSGTDAVATITEKVRSFVSVIPTPLLQGLAVVVGTVTAAIVLQTGATVAWSAATGAAAAVTGLFATTVNLETGATQRGTIARLAHNVAVGVGAVAAFVAATPRVLAHTAATVAGTVASLAARGAAAAWTAAQWLLNAALTANPIGLVIAAIALLAAGIFLAYKKSETFRDIVHTVWDVLRKFIGFTPLGALLTNLDKVKAAFGWVLDKVHDLIDALGKIKMPKLDLPGGGLLKKLPGFASGGTLPAGWSWTGERGPELVYSARGGERVFSRDDSLGMATAPGASVTQNIYVTSGPDGRSQGRAVALGLRMAL